MDQDDNRARGELILHENLRHPQTVPCWCIIFFQAKSNQPSWIFIHSLVEYLSRMSAAPCLIIALMIDDDDKKTRVLTRKWIQRREEEGMYANLVQELLVEDTRTYREMMRMSYESFKKILGFIEPHITPKDSAVIGA